MKKIIIAILFISLWVQACKKNETIEKQISSFNVVNAAIDIASAKVYAADHLINWKPLPITDAVAFTRASFFGAYAGNNYIRSVSATDTTKVLFSSNNTEEFKPAAFNTLFLCGQNGAYEGVFIKDDQIVNYTDQVMGIRIINLSPNSTPVNITLSTTSTINETTGLAYKQITDFKTYPADATVVSMIFQIRNSTGTLLASYTLPAKTPVSPYTNISIAHARFKNVTLVIKGLIGTTTGANAFGVFPVSHY
ncbi:MAG TPA: hypothetical protein VK541_04820 [Pedobacter sp.]|uniref:hypothetical protein n=1 Tax=Pedobacter sp. TaxID=1411316 RepID=UPI002CC1A79B|nr:hypothetical protein [Pedobacter sp.]HMI01781.1 hypothetical protein [Pedobacter sp.]